MRRYWFQLLDEQYNEFDISINDSSNKTTAVNAAKRWMRANDIKSAILSVNSMRTSNLLEVIYIEL